MDDGAIAVTGLYGAAIIPWALLSLWSARRARAWRFTPSWHAQIVPAFRAFFLASLPLEFLLAERVFIPPLFVLGAAGTFAWMAWRAWYLFRMPFRLPREDSVHYNLGYIANLLAFALACHSFVCIAVMVNVSIPLLLVRERLARSCRHSPNL